MREILRRQNSVLRTLYKQQKMLLCQQSKTFTGNRKQYSNKLITNNPY